MQGLAYESASISCGCRAQEPVFAIECATRDGLQGAPGSVSACICSNKGAAAPPGKRYARVLRQRRRGPNTTTSSVQLVPPAAAGRAARGTQ